MKLIIKLFPEIMVKSRPVRQRMIKQLRTNLRRTLKEISTGIDVSGSWDRLVIATTDTDSDTEETILTRVRNTPGIHHILKVDSYSFTDLDDILQQCIPIYTDLLKGKTFCVRAKRGGKHDFTSHQLEQKVGGGLLHNTEAAGVKLREPEVTVKLEIRDDKFLVINDRYKGLGGFPLGLQGMCLSLISGGYDSTVASYLMTKRGICTHYCFFNLGGVAHEVGVKQVAHFIWEKYGKSQRVKFYAVPFQQVITEILENVHHSMMGVILKRMMLRAGEQIAVANKIPAIVTGEAIAQVSSQTMTNLAVIDDVANCLVLRPLATMDKEDIIALSREIGTEDYARTMPEYCGVISDRPTTEAKMHKILHEEERFNFKVLDKAIADTEVTGIDKVLESSKNLFDIEMVGTPLVDDVILDIRHPLEQEKSPLELTNNKVFRLPFFEIAKKFPTLDNQKKYLLYCDKGIMSQLQTQELMQQGFNNVGVYRPS